MDRKRTVISPGAFIEMIKRTLLVMLGRRPVSGSYAADPDGVWQAIWASVVISVGIGVSLKMTVASAIHEKQRLFLTCDRIGDLLNGSV